MFGSGGIAGAFRPVQKSNQSPLGKRDNVVIDRFRERLWSDQQARTQQEFGIEIGEPARGRRENSGNSRNIGRTMGRPVRDDSSANV